MKLTQMLHLLNPIQTDLHVYCKVYPKSNILVTQSNNFSNQCVKMSYVPPDCFLAGKSNFLESRLVA